MRSAIDKLLITDRIRIDLYIYSFNVVHSETIMEPWWFMLTSRSPVYCFQWSRNSYFCCHRSWDWCDSQMVVMHCWCPDLKKGSCFGLSHQKNAEIVEFFRKRLNIEVKSSVHNLTPAVLKGSRCARFDRSKVQEWPIFQEVRRGIHPCDPRRIHPQFLQELVKSSKKNERSSWQLRGVTGFTSVYMLKRCLNCLSTNQT